MKSAYFYRRFLTATILGLAVFGASAASAVTLQFAHVDPSNWQTSKKGAAAHMFKDYVEARTDIDVKLYPNGQLGDESQLIQQTQSGAIAMSMVSGAFSRFCPAVGVTNIPYIFPNAPVAWKVMDGAFGEALAKHCLDKTGMRIVGYGETGFRNFTNSKHPIKTPKDLDGLKIRIMKAPAFRKMVEALGYVTFRS